MTTVELTDWEQVQYGDEQAKPSGEPNRIQHEVVARGYLTNHKILQRRCQERIAENQGALAFEVAHGDDFGS